MKPVIDRTHPLKEIDSGLWIPKDISQKEFAYSDGERFEKYLTRILDNASDLSSTSEELEQAGIDWPSACHFSRKRSRIIAGLEMGKEHRVLEVGSGCGAITRYLADQGHLVDGIEGSFARASIARKRCLDNSNVNFIVANFNDLKIPSAAYHVVLFIGVLEYAQRFSVGNLKPKQAVRQMLERALDVITTDGCIVIAIENRLGFKYAYGAGEDHYGLPYIGIAGYPMIPGTRTEEKKGIFTYSQDEWEQILSEINGLHYEFYYPFPDYKFPDIVMSEHFVNSNHYAGNLTRKTPSFDQTGDWQSPVDEYSYWRHAAQIGSLGKSANSFGIVLSKNPESVSNMLQFDFIQFPNQKRKKALQTRVAKKRSSARVERVRISTENTPDSLFRLEPQTDIYHAGRLLLDYWADILRSNPNASALAHLVHELYEKKVEWFAQSHDEHHNVDLTILNILVDTEGKWRLFDREWFTTSTVTVETLMFRSLLYFACIHSKNLYFVEDLGWHTVYDFVDGCFDMLGLNFPSNYPELVTLENKFQRYALKEQYYVNAEERLSQRLSNAQTADTTLLKYQSKLYFADKTGAFSDDRTLKLESPVCDVKRHLVFTVFETCLRPGALLRLRFDPADETSAQHERTLKINAMSVSIQQEGKRKHLWSSNRSGEIANKLKTFNMSKKEHQGEVLYTVKHPDPQMLFEQHLPHDIAHIGTVVFEVSFSLERSHQFYE